jgi:hypothetical protein
MTKSDAGKASFFYGPSYFRAYLSVAEADDSRINNAAESKITILMNGIENCVINNEYTNIDNTIGAPKELTIIIATTVCNLAPTKSVL